MEFISRFFGRLFNSDAPAEPASLGSHHSDLKVQPTARLSDLETTIEHQRRQIARARSLLQSAAFLAGYHQPSLARDIRTLLTEIEAQQGENRGLSSPGISSWPFDTPAPRSLSA